MFPPQKKAKCEDLSGPSLSALPDPTLGCISAGCMPERQDIQNRRVDNEGYLIEATKERSAYTKRDLPVPCDRRWSHSFTSTAILWYSVQNNVWNVPEEMLVSALQRIFSVVYPGIKYRVIPTGSVFAVVSRFILSTLARVGVLTRTDTATYPRVAGQPWLVRAGDDVTLFLLARRSRRHSPRRRAPRDRSPIPAGGPRRVGTYGDVLLLVSCHAHWGHAPAWYRGLRGRAWVEHARDGCWKRWGGRHCHYFGCGALIPLLPFFFIFAPSMLTNPFTLVGACREFFSRRHPRRRPPPRQHRPYGRPRPGPPKDGPRHARPTRVAVLV